MKKLVMALMLCLVSICATAQVTIEKQEKRYEFPLKNYTAFVHDLKEDTYCLVISSDNEYESKSAVIQLGNKDEALASIISMIDMTKTDGEYKLAEYSCFVYSKCIFLHNVGKLEYTAGTYSISPINLKKCRKWLEAQ